jgi:flagellar protein FliO/FliZ
MELIDMPVAAKFIVAFVLVLVLIGAFALLWRRFAGGPLSTSGPRGRQPRLAVIDAAAVDARRRLVLIRRDNTEHLLMIGGPSDIVIESNIARAAANSAMRELRPGPTTDIPGRAAIDAQGWSQPFETMPRVARPIEPPYPPAPAGEGRDGPRPEPTPRLPRDPMAVEPAARTPRIEPGVRLAPPGSAERFRPDFDNDEVTAPALTPTAMPPEPAYHAAPEPRRAPVQPIPPSYEPVFQTAPAPERRPPAPTPPPAADEPAFQKSTEPRRAPVRSAPPSYEPVFQSAAMPEPQWAQAPPTSASAQESGHQMGHQPGHSPVFQSTVITESKRAQTVPPRPSQTDENNLAEMAQRLEAALRRPIKPVEPAPVPRAAAPAEPVANPGARVAAYFDAPAPPARAPAARAQEAAPAPVLKVVPAQDKIPSLEEEMASLLGRSTGKT